MRYPDFLKKEGRVGFIAPSFGCTSEPYRILFEKTLDKMKNMGYKTVLGPNCYEERGRGKSNTASACAAEINDFFLNDRSDVIISCGGGETMCEDLAYVDFEGIGKAVPKWYMGYSDNTNLTFTLNTLCDTASIYGPCAASFGEEPSPLFIKDAWKILTGEKLYVENYDEWFLEPGLCGISIPEGGRVFTVDENDEYMLGAAPCDLDVVYVNDKQYIKMPYRHTAYVGEVKTEEAECSGRLVGGCLDCLSNLVGTKYDRVKEYNERYKKDGFIWFMEACDLGAMSIRRALWQLESAGWFKYVKGFLIGRPLHYNDEFDGFGRLEAVTGILGKYNVPIIMDIDLGHLSPAMPIISGAIGNVSVSGSRLKLSYTLK